MTNDTRTIDEIERDIADERAQMNDTFDDLQKKFSLDTFVNDLGDMFRDQGGDLGRRVSQTVGRNPAAVAVVGVGFAWLILGKDRTPSAGVTERSSRQGSGRRGVATGRRTRNTDAWTPGGHAAEGLPSWYRNAESVPDRRTNGRGVGHDGQLTDDAETSGGMAERVRDAAGTVRHAISDAAGSWGETASDLTARLSEGLEDLSEESRSRVVSARRAAHEARLSSKAMINKGARRASTFYEDQPLVIGALAAALGAAFGAALPHSKVEDDVMGDSRDRLVAEAEAVFREERDKAMATARKVGQTVAAEVRSDVKDMGSAVEDLLPEGKSASDVAVDHASDAAGRVAGSATGKSGQSDLNRNKT